MKIIFFSSHTATWYFAFAEASLAFALKEKGHNILFVTPGDLFKGMSSLKQEKILRKEFDLQGYDLENVLTERDFEKVNIILKKINKNNFEKLVLDDVYIGKIALYEFLLHSKKMSAKLTDAEWKECTIYLKNTLISFFACRNIVKKEKPERILMFNTLYSVNHVWERYAKIKNIPVYLLHNGSNLSDLDGTLIIAKNDPFYLMDSLKKVWIKLRGSPVLQKGLSYVTDNLLELIKAKHFLVYSTPKSKEHVNLRKIFNVTDNQKILTATMSSYDEVFAAKYVGVWNIYEKLIFATQVIWIKELINYVKNKHDLFLIIRVHPREFPNKRESVKSDHAKMLEKVLKNLPDNVKVNWPADNISIYDIAQETDVFLNAWSSVGVEMSLLGIPVVVYSKDLILYPSDLNYLAKNKKDYFTKIELALRKGWNYERIKKTYRWLALYYYHTIVRLRDKKIGTKPSISTRLISDITNYVYHLIPSKIKGFLIKVYYAIPGLGVGKKQVNDCRRQLIEHVDISSVEKMIKESGDTLVDVEKILKNGVTEKEEDFYIKHEVKRMYYALYGNMSDQTKMKKDSLQYNLKQVFEKK